MGKFIIQSMPRMTTFVNVSLESPGANTSTDETDDDWQQDALSFAGKIVYTSVICPLIVICILGNAVTIISYFTDPKLQTVQNIYLVNLAFADFFIGLVSMPFYFVTTILDYRWIFGRLFCKMWNGVDFVVCLVSAYAVVLISADRSLMVWEGAAYSVRQTKKCAIIRIIISWCFAIAVYVPAILFWDIWRGYSILADGVCELEFYKNVPYTLSTAILEFVVPFLSITILSIYLYCAIIKKSRTALNTRLWSNSSAKSQASFHTIFKDLSRTEENLDEKTEQNSNGGSSSSSLKQKGIRNKEPDEIERRILRRNQRAARRLAILVGVFVVCWTPYTVVTIIIALCDDCVSDHLYEALIWLQWANSAINPFLYALTSPRFRQNYIRLLHLKRRKRGQRKKTLEDPPPERTSLSSCHH